MRSALQGPGSMRNATFTTRGPLPNNTSLKTAASASRFDAILRGNYTRTQRAPQYVKKSSPFDAIVQNSEQRIQQLGFQKPSKAPSPFDAIVQSQLQSQMGMMSPTRSSRGHLDITPKTSNARMAHTWSMKRAQSVPHHVSANYLDSKWGASSPTGKTKNAVFGSALPKPVRRGSNDSKPSNKQLQGRSTKKKPSPFDAIVQSTMELGLQSPKEDSKEPQAPPQDDTPKSSNTKKLQLPNLLNAKLQQQQSSRLRRAQSVPVHVANNKWESSPTSSTNKNAVFDLNKPVRKGSIDLMPLDEKKKVFRTLAKRQAKKNRQLCPLSKSRTNAFGGTSLLEASALEILLSKPMPRQSPSRSQCNMILPRNQ